jgi:hypothetical protein
VSGSHSVVGSFGGMALKYLPFGLGNANGLAKVVVSIFLTKIIEAAPS